jgi:hypothetical protein
LTLHLIPDSNEFEIAVLQAENALYRKRIAKMKVEIAELRAQLDRASHRNNRP